MYRKISIMFFLFFITHSLFSQENYDGYILCIDNSSRGLQQKNEYYYIPLNFLNNNVFYDNETLEHKDDKLESKIRASDGIKIYKYIYDFDNETCIEIRENDLDYYSDTTFRLVFFHYHNEKGDSPEIDKDFFLKKIKHNKYYLCKIRFKGCKLIDKNFTKSKVLKMFVYAVDEIKPASKEEKNQIISFIKDAYCTR